MTHHSVVCVTECFPDDVITDKAEPLTPVYLMTTLMPDVPAATGNLKYTAHGFDIELSLMVSMKTYFISGASRSMSRPSG
ncbi:hypothetical protein SEEE2558_17135 [Salmonella enterica subsp. enterica serovar Enteritidis str. 22558]|nr:hypothetical protein SEEE2558_17135 [Salmonella enterica subsp. enterica serovar Enteritidis str. 22558]